MAMINHENENVKIWFVEKSGNKKVGIMSVSYTTANTCPLRCPFKGNGCYAENFPCCFQWKKAASKGVTSDQLQKVVENSNHTEIIRHNVAGDIAVENSNTIDKYLVDNLVKAYKGAKAYTYTHCEINDYNIEIVKNACKNGFVINFSTENMEDLKKAMNAGCNAVITCSTISENTIVKDGVKIVCCPSISSGGKIHCNECKLCTMKNRNFAIAFPVHGNQRKKAQNAGFLSDL